MTVLSLRRPIISGLRDYGVKGQIGLEKTLNEYLDKILAITAECKRVLKKTGTMWWNHGDSYGTGSGAGERNGLQRTNRGTQNFEKWKKDGKSKVQGYEKCLLFQNYRLAIRMIDEQQWIARNVIIWHKPNAMPSSVKDRFSVDYEPVFFFTKSKKYFFEPQYEPFESNDYDRARMAKAREVHGGKWAEQSGGAIKTQRAFVAGGKLGRNKRCVWRINTNAFSGTHFATFPAALIETPIRAGCPHDGIVLDIFMGSGTTAVVARSLGRKYIGIELNKSYIKLANDRLRQRVLI